MDSEEPPNVRVACSGDIDEVVRLMHDAAAWMSAKGTPAWDVARIDRTFAETFVLRSELLVASCSDGIVGCCTLSAEDPEFWPDALKGEAAYLHKLAVRRTHAGRGVSSALIEACRHAGGAGLDEKPEHREARFLSDGRQGGYSIYRFHVSIIVEIWSVLNSSFKL